MDKILYRNPSKSEVIGRCGGDGKNEWPRRTDKTSNAKKKKKEVEFRQLFRMFCENVSQFKSTHFSAIQRKCYLPYHSINFHFIFN